jgi:hypothetical protein
VSHVGNHISYEDESVRSIIYPPETRKEDPEIERQYNLSHGSTKPGQQKRYYGPNWSPPEHKDQLKPKIDTDGHVEGIMYWHTNREAY